jgi:hypothetical protein
MSKIKKNGKTSVKSKDQSPSWGIMKPYTPGDLCDMYSITPKVLRTWLRPFRKQIGKRYGRIYNLRQVDVIFEKLGKPDGAEE